MDTCLSGGASAPAQCSLLNRWYVTHTLLHSSCCTLMCLGLLRGAVLTQDIDSIKGVVAYASQYLSAMKKTRWCTYDRELWAIARAVQHSRHYLGLRISHYSYWPSAIVGIMATPQSQWQNRPVQLLGLEVGPTWLGGSQKWFVAHKCGCKCSVQAILQHGAIYHDSSLALPTPVNACTQTMDADFGAVRITEMPTGSHIATYDSSSHALSELEAHTSAKFLPG